MKQKIISIILSILTIVGIAPTVLAQNSIVGLENFKKENSYVQGQFSDVASSAWYADSVANAYELGLVKGSTATSFNPTGNITIAETIVLACRLHSICNGGNGEFTQGDPWYQVYIDYALANGIIYQELSDYNAKISRADFAYILSNALPIKALGAINNIADGALYDVSHDYRANSIYMLYRAGILTGNDKYGTFNPDSTILRSEVATIVTRMANKDLRKTFTLSKLNKSGSISAEVDEISIKSGESYTFMVTTYKYDLTLVVNYNSDQVETIWGEWQGNSCPLTIKALNRGDSQLKIYFEEEPTSCIYIDVYVDRIEHYHSYSIEEIAPSCTEQGYTVYRCVCGDSYKDDYIEPKGHIEVIDSAVPATETSAGLTEGKHCSVCGNVLVKQESIPKLEVPFSEMTKLSIKGIGDTCSYYLLKEKRSSTYIHSGSYEIDTIGTSYIEIQIDLIVELIYAKSNYVAFKYELYDSNDICVKSGGVFKAGNLDTKYNIQIRLPVSKPDNYTLKLLDY